MVAPGLRRILASSRGPHSSIDDRMDHPVVHLLERRGLLLRVVGDEAAEAEWEYAARGGLEQSATRGAMTDTRWRVALQHLAGHVPFAQHLEDGYLGTAPVDSFPPNGFGLHNVSGNVWEWCSDWFATTFHLHGPREIPPARPSVRRR